MAPRLLDEWGPLVIKPMLMGERDSLEAMLAPVAERIVWSSSFETPFGLINSLRLINGLLVVPSLSASVLLERFRML